MLKNRAWAHKAVTGGSRMWTWHSLSPELEPLPCAVSCYGTGEHGFKAGGKGLHAIIHSGQLIFGSAVSPLCLLSCSHLPKPTHQQLLGVAVSLSCMPGPHLDVEVVHSLSGCRWLTFMATVLSIAIFVLTQEEHTRAQNEAEWNKIITTTKLFVPAPTTYIAILLP